MPNFKQELQQSLGPQFIVDAEAGSGGMATVFVARDTALDRRVAVKVLVGAGRGASGGLTTNHGSGGMDGAPEPMSTMLYARSSRYPRIQHE